MKNYTFLFAVLLSNLLFAQGDWVKMMQDPNVNFYDVQKAFYQQHKEEKEANLKEEDESEYRFFKRLEYELLPRVFPAGKLPSPDLAWKEIQKYRQQHPIPSANHAKNITSPTWTSLGPDSLSGGSWSPGLGRVNVVMVDPIDSNKIYIGSPSGGLWKSADGGHTWATTTDNLPVLGVSTIAIDPTNTNVIYIGTSDNDAWECFSIGILKSTDGGNTWNTTGMSYTVDQGAKIYSLLIDPTNHNTLLAATTSGVFKTTDGAATWTQVSTITNIRDLQFKPGNHNVVYAVNNDFFRSINNGNSFTQITSGLPADTLVNRLKIGVTAANPNAVYVIAGQNGGNGYFGLYYSNDGGLNFSTRSNSPNILGYAYDGSSGGGQDWYTLALAVSPTDENEVFAGGVNIWKSNDGGVNWSLNAFWEPAPFCPVPAGYVHADIHTLVIFNHTLFSGCDGGIWKSPDHGNTWNSISDGLCITEFYRLGGTPYNPNVIYAGAQDNGIIKYNAGSWSQVQGADGMVCRMDYSNYNNVYVSLQVGYLEKSGDGGQTFGPIYNPITESGAWITPMELDPNNPNIVYAAFKHIWKSYDGGLSWDTLNGLGTTFILTTMAIAPSNPNYIYCGNNTHVYRTTDGGSTWNEVTNNLPVSNVAMDHIAIDPNNPDIVYVTGSSYQAGQKVFKSITGGVGANSWTNISGTLPNIAANCITVQKGGNHTLFVGMDVGVYYRDTTMNDWAVFGTGLPDVKVDEMEINYTANKLRAATYGRGLWEVPLPNSSPLNPIAYFFSDRDSICPAQTVYFHDQSLYSNGTWNWDFPGGSPSFSHQQDPIVTYNAVGNYAVSLWVTNGSVNDTLTELNFINVANPIASTLPVVEGFESTSFIPVDWRMLNPDNSFTWMQYNHGAYGTSGHSAYISNYNYNGEGDAIETPAYDIPANGSTVLTFDVAYARQIPALSDTLIINSTNDCGNTFTNVYYKGGSNLATSPDNLNEFYPADTEWRHETVNLSAISGMSGMQFQFINKSGWGNDLYLDNINITHTTGIPNVNLNTDCKVFPNPVNDLLTIDWRNNNAYSLNISIYNSFGQKVFEKFIPPHELSSLNVDCSRFAAGIYLVRIDDGNTSYQQKIIK